MKLEDKLIKKLLISYEGFLCYLHNNQHRFGYDDLKDKSNKDYKEWVLEQCKTRIDELEQFYEQIIDSKEISTEFKKDLFKFLDKE